MVDDRSKAAVVHVPAEHFAFGGVSVKTVPNNIKFLDNEPTLRTMDAQEFERKYAPYSTLIVQSDSQKVVAGITEGDFFEFEDVCREHWHTDDLSSYLACPGPTAGALMHQGVDEFLRNSHVERESKRGAKGQTPGR